MKKTLSVLLFAFVLIAFMSVCNFFSSQAQTTIYVQKLSTPTPTPTPGGGPAEYAELFSSVSADDMQTTPYTTGSFTPTAGSYLVVIAAIGDGYGEGLGQAAAMQVDDTGQDVTWTPIIADENESYGYPRAIKAWITASPVTASSTTLTFSMSGGRGAYRYLVTVVEVTGTDGTVVGAVSDGDAPFDGPHTQTLSVTPTVDDVVFYARAVVTGGSVDGGLSMDTGWTVVNDTYGPSDDPPFAVAANDNLASSTVSILDMLVTNVSGELGSAELAFIVKAG